MHLRRRPLKESAATTDEQGVAGENDALIAVLQVVADGVLRVAGGVEGADSDVGADLEFGVVRGRAGDQGTVFAANDGERAAELTQNLLVSSSVIMMTGDFSVWDFNSDYISSRPNSLMRIDNRRQIDLPLLNPLLQHRCNPTKSRLAKHAPIQGKKGLHRTREGSPDR